MSTGNLIEFRRERARKSTVRPVGVFTEEAPARRKNAADPLKDPRDIQRVSEWFLTHGDVRDNLLFILGINTGFRCGDLLKFRVGHLLNDDGSYRDEVRFVEQKTGKTRRFFLNEAIMDAADLFLEELNNTEGGVDLNAYLFRSRSGTDSPVYYEKLREKGMEIDGGVGTPISVYSVERILKKVINDELGIQVNAGTHLLRKTFAYHCIMQSPDRTRAIEFLQRILGHSSAAITLAYAGITDEEIRSTYKKLNLGMRRVLEPTSAVFSAMPAGPAGTKERKDS